MKKKLLSLALAFALCLGLTVPVSAAEVLTEKITDTITFTYDPNSGTLTYTGTGELLIADFLGLGEEFMAYTKSENPEIKTVTINIGPGITLEDESIYEDVCKELREVLAPIHEITTVNINRNAAPTQTPAPSPAPAPTPAPAPAPAATVSKFTDVAANSPYKDAINWAVEKGITKGTTATTFGPNQTCSISHIMTFISRYMGAEPVRGEISEACTALSSEFNMTLKPDQPCTRILAVNLLFLVADDGSRADVSFTDLTSNNFSRFFDESVDWAVAKGITTGTSATTFSPDKICTRGQIVTFLYRLDKAK